MKSLHFIFLLSLPPLCLSAQSERDSVDVYCTIANQYRLMAKDITTVDYGLKKEKKSQTLPKHLEKDEYRESFGSMAEAMNYLSVRGWVYVEIYGVSVGDATALNFCLMRKRMAAGEVEKD